MRKYDTIVIGAGIAGLSAAARCANHSDVLVLEAEAMAGMHASGRSVASLHFGIGDALIRNLTMLSRESLSAPPVQDQPPLAVTHPAMFIARTEDAAALDKLEEVHRRFVPDFQLLDAAAAKELVPVLDTSEGGFAYALIDPGALKLDPNAMLQGHIRELRAAGGELMCNAAITGLQRKRECWIVDTAGGTFQAKRIVNAAGAWADRIAYLAGVLPIGIRPLRRTVISFKATRNQNVACWPFTKTVGAGFYMLPEGSGLLLASAMDETPSIPCDAAAEEMDIAIAADQVQQGTDLTISRIEHSWAGLRSFAPDNHPVVGYDHAAPGFFWLAGQGGFGLQTSPALARVAQALIHGLDWPEEFDALGMAPSDFTPQRFAP